MNDFLCRGYEARVILDEVYENAAKQKSTQQQLPAAASSFRSRTLMTDQGSSGYRDWLRRSTRLEELYRHMEKGDAAGKDDGDTFVDDEELRVVEEERKKNEQQQQKGSRIRSKPKVRPSKKRPSTTTKEPILDSEEAEQSLRDEYAEYPEYAPPQEVVYADTWTGLGFNAKDMFDITLTALAFLAFGLFILNRVGPQSVMFVTNNTTPSLPVQKREVDWSGNVTLERALRWAQQPPAKGYLEEKMARYALYSLRAALEPTPKSCVQFALCSCNKAARKLGGQAKYWLPVWSLGMGWLAREKPNEGPGPPFAGALDNVRAAVLGFAGVQCRDSYTAMAKRGRLTREMKMMAKKSRPGVFLGPVGDSLDDFEATITGVEGTPYESGIFKMEVKIPETYPFSAPAFRFTTKVYHPNIDSSGRICLKSLKPPPAGDWTPALTLIDVVQEIRMLLKHPNPDDSLMPDIAQQYITDREKFNETALKMTKLYAAPDQTSKPEEDKSQDPQPDSKPNESEEAPEEESAAS
ncbi:hypothetical protein B566_EDAN007498 [Ephemera danica]|nr:hypothetical protein B566_EDAN007498 [Ephemera danica]